MTKFTIACTWTEYGEQKIEAESLREAMKKAMDWPLPKKTEYVDDSFRVDIAATMELNDEKIEKSCYTCEYLSEDYPGKVCKHWTDPCLDKDGKCGLWFLKV